MRKIKKIGIICMLIMIFLCQPVYAYAAKKGSITASYPCAGMRVELYHVADVGKNSDFVLTKRFEKYPIRLNEQTKEEWSGQAQALETYIHRDQLNADQTKSTDSSGKVVFSNLSKGMYLIMTQVHEENGYTYKTMPYFVTIPSKSVNGKIQYNVATTAKYDKTPSNQDEKDYKVVKIWSDKGHEKIRPKNITVQLLRDGSIYQEVVLSEKNNWQYTWKNLSSQYQWEVIEKDKSDEYFVSVSKQETSFIIKNIFWDDEPYDEPTTTKKSKTTTIKEQKAKTTKNHKTTKQERSKLPQTGQLWWPLPFLLFGGTACIGIGIARQKRENNEKK